VVTFLFRSDEISSSKPPTASLEILPMNLSQVVQGFFAVRRTRLAEML
jgi:hypothetical protein